MYRSGLVAATISLTVVKDITTILNIQIFGERFFGRRFELWNPGTLELWNFGTLEPWNFGT
jgi:hypothetical protein